MSDFKQHRSNRHLYVYKHGEKGGKKKLKILVEETISNEVHENIFVTSEYGLTSD